MKMFPPRDYCAYFAIFKAGNGDQYKAELMSEDEMEARSEAWSAFGQDLVAIHLEHVATGYIVLEIPWPDDD